MLGLFEHSHEYQTFHAGDILFEEGTPGDVMYVILEGQVDISVRNRSLYLAGAGEMVGEMALIDSESRSATARAKTDCRVVPVNEESFLFLVQQTPSFSIQVMRILTKRLRLMDAKV